ncbi:MAG: ATP synthase F1 subunit delta [Gemmatimonadetes bacterium]|nr:ATP synthase F1 subunit delta [Gemmatimonadota bacterium]
MRAEIIARNYAETLMALAERQRPAALEEFGGALDELAGMLQTDPRTRQFLETPRVRPEQKKEALRQALAGRAPEMFVRFVMVLVDKRRQSLLPEVAQAYRALVDQRMGRARVDVTISHAPDDALQQEIQRGLEAQLGRTVIPTFRVAPDLLGGMVLRLGDEILDGSVRSRASALRRRLMETQMPLAARE